MSTDQKTLIEKLKRFLSWLGLPVAVILIGVLIGGYFKKTAPKAERKAPPRNARLVEVLPLSVSNEQVMLQAMGTVKAAREVMLQPRVSGQIIEIGPHFIPGGFLAAGETLAKLEATDYELVLRQRESEVTRIKSDLALERGQQTIAARELELLGQKISEEDRELVLRKPQLEKVEAELAVAETAVEQARLDLERATVTAPFNAMVRDREADLGMQVTPSMALASLTGTDAYWIEVLLPVSQLRWIEVPTTMDELGSEVKITHDAWGENRFRKGRVLRLLGDLESQGRMARLLVEVKDPLALQADQAGQSRMLLGEYVQVTLEGRTLNQVMALPRSALRDNDTIWIMGADNTLEIRSVEVAYKGLDTVFLKNGLTHEDRLIVSDLSAPVQGMLLRTAGNQGERP